MTAAHPEWVWRGRTRTPRVAVHTAQDAAHPHHTDEWKAMTIPDGLRHPTRRLRNEDGATAVEYALMASLIAVVIIGSVTAFGLGVQGLFASVPPGL